MQTRSKGDGNNWGRIQLQWKTYSEVWIFPIRVDWQVIATTLFVPLSCAASNEFLSGQGCAYKYALCSGKNTISVTRWRTYYWESFAARKFKELFPATMSIIKNWKRSAFFTIFKSNLLMLTGLGELFSTRLSVSKQYYSNAQEEGKLVVLQADFLYYETGVISCALSTAKKCI